jgi:hypothetical protein
VPRHQRIAEIERAPRAEAEVRVERDGRSARVRRVAEWCGRGGGTVLLRRVMIRVDHPGRLGLEQRARQRLHSRAANLVV